MSWDMSRVIGHNAKARRLELEMDVATFGTQMEEALGRPWKRQTVSAMENGDRAMTANDLVAIAHVLSTTAATLLIPPLEADGVQVGNLQLEPRALMGGSKEGEFAGLLLELMDEVREAYASVNAAERQLINKVRLPLMDMDRRITETLNKI